MASVQWFPTGILKDDQLDFLLPTSTTKRWRKMLQAKHKSPDPHSDKAR